nr:ATP-binding protein [Ruegeria arenilitoris]
MDAQDIEEVIGNLLDNAFKWSRQKVILTAQYKDGDIELRVEDDGPGVPEKEHREALRSGGRLDTSVAGTGLGLAITVDLLNAYGAKLVLGSSDVLGGLESSVFIPSSQVV